MIEDDGSFDERAFWQTVKIVVMAFLGLAWLSLMLWASTKPAPARERYPGQYAQVDPGIRDWFSAQRVPGGGSKGGLCCSLADGTRAEEEREGNRYRTRFWFAGNNGEQQSDWMDVPEETVIHGGTNPTGGAVVWYMTKADGEGRISPLIRCFKPSSDV